MEKDIKTGFELGLDGGEASVPKTPSKSQKADYKVGYGRPPIDKWFKKGVSGNPKGRPKHPVTARESMNKIMGEMNSVTINGKKKKMPTLETFHRKLIAMALNGNAQLIGLIVKYYMQDVNITSILYPPNQEKIPKEIEEAMDIGRELIVEILNERHRG